MWAVILYFLYLDRKFLRKRDIVCPDYTPIDSQILESTFLSIRNLLPSKMESFNLNITFLTLMRKRYFLLHIGRPLETLFAAVYIMN